MMNNLSQISSLTIVSDCSGFSFLGWGQGRGGKCLGACAKTRTGFGAASLGKQLLLGLKL